MVWKGFLPHFSKKEMGFFILDSIEEEYVLGYIGSVNSQEKTKSALL
jgi:hypothetical protein